MPWRLLIFASVALFGVSASAADWLTAPSYYSHDWSSGERVAQYSAIGPFYYYQRPDFQRSGYRHYRSTLDLGNTSDNMHIVETLVVPVVPYEQWRFPFRPFSVPYQEWGPPFGGLGGGTGGYPYSGGNGANIWGGFFPPWGLGGPSGFGGVAPGIGNAGMSNLGPAAADASPGFGFPGHFPGHFPNFFNPPAVNFAQPWLDGHYPSYDFNDRSRYWQPYTPAFPPRF